MSQAISFTCTCCGQVRHEWPALTFIAPDAYAGLSDEDKATMGELDTDFCVIRHDEQVDRFVRVTFTQPVTDGCQDLDYGVWVSLSEKSFNNYANRFGDATDEGGVEYFGWLSNRIPGYLFEAAIPTTVCTRANNDRPEIFPHRDFDHPFVHDYYNGITKAKALRRIQAMLDQLPPVAASVTLKKPWWKVW